MSGILNVFTFGAVFFISAGEVVFVDSGSEIGILTNISVSDCNKSLDVCKLLVLTDATIEIDFELLYDEMVSNVTAVVHGDGVRFSLENPDACIISGLSCPLLKNKTHKYVQSLPVKLYYPPVNDRIKYIIGFKHFRLRIDVTIRWVLEDANTQKNIVCVLIPASIVYWVL